MYEGFIAKSNRRRKKPMQDQTENHIYTDFNGDSHYGEGGTKTCDKCGNVIKGVILTDGEQTADGETGHDTECPKVKPNW